MVEALTLLAAVLLLQNPATFRADSTLVTLPCVVTRNDHTLKLEDLHLYADGKLQEIQNLLSAPLSREF